MTARVVFSTRIDEDVLVRTRGAVLGMSRLEPGWTMARIVEEALDAYLTQLQDQHNEGQPWPDETSPIPAGSPLRSRRTQ